MNRHLMFSSVLLLTAILLTVPPLAAQTLSRHSLIDDTRYLARTIESVHPDPYLNSGGKIAFHRCLHTILEAIPDSGLTREAYYTLVRPLVASVGDAHTAMFDPRSFDPYSPGGIPLYFATGLEGLYVMAVLSGEQSDLIGARLVSVESVPLAEMLNRYRRLKGAENDYLLYQNLGGTGVLWHRHTLRDLIPEWTRSDSIQITLRLPNDELVTRTFAIPDKVDYAAFVFAPMRDPELVGELMAKLQQTDIFYRFLEPDRQTCLLVIHSLATYREAFEVWHSYGIENREIEGRRQYQRYHGTEPPADYNEVLAGLPSLTELLAELADEMKDAGTRNLIIDLTQNDGGSSVASHILLYILYGRQTAMNVRGSTTEIVKYSPEYFDIFPSPTLDDINTERAVALEVNDYDFTGDYDSLGGADRKTVISGAEAMIARMPTFHSEYQSGRYSSYHTPERILVLSDAGTFSAAFTLLFYLREAGAETVGTPSAQSGNCFGDIIPFTLPNSGLDFTCSRKYFELFPGDEEKGRVLMPDYPLTYDKMVEYNFDPNMWLTCARDILAADSARL